MYHRSEYKTTAPYYDKYETFFRGYYNEDYDNEAGTSEVLMVLGCKDYIDYSAAIPETSAYGLCMRGWIQYMELFVHPNAVWSTAINRDTIV